jgi:hypothetical protein
VVLRTSAATTTSAPAWANLWKSDTEPHVSQMGEAQRKLRNAGARREFGVSRLLILEWLPFDEDIFTGSELYDRLMKRAGHTIPVKIVRCTSAA